MKYLSQILSVYFKGEENISYRVVDNKKLVLEVDEKKIVVESEVWDPLKDVLSKKIYNKVPEMYELKDGDVVKITDIWFKNHIFVQTKNCSLSMKEVVQEIQNFKGNIYRI